MAFDAFLKIDSIQGESQDSKFTNQIEILSYSFGASMPANVSGTGLGAGKVKFDDFSIMKHVDKASSKFLTSMCQGTHIPTATFSVRKAGGGTTGGYVYLQVTLSNALVTALHLSGAGDAATESASFAYTKIKFEYFQQTASGSVASTGATTYDIATNQAT